MFSPVTHPSQYRPAARDGGAAGAVLDPRRMPLHGAGDEYDGSLIARTDDIIVVVSINYRLGAFGFWTCLA